jgi:CRISPR-associated endoribonuclease Cas6
VNITSSLDNAYPISYYRLTCILGGLALPDYPGSGLRGAFGYALKKVCCINPSLVCAGCFASSQCLYFDFYEEKSKAHKYRFASSYTSQSGFEIYLYASATDKLPYVLSAIKTMIEEIGLGVNRSLGSLKAIYADDALVYNGSKFDISKLSCSLFKPVKLSQKLRIDLVTPLRLKSNEKRVDPEDIDILKVCLSILGRYNELIDNPRQKQFITTKAVLLSKELVFTDTTRYSNRQNTKMNLGGFTGKFLYDNVESEIGNILQLGEIIGVGKSCVFGLGQIKLEEVE